MLPDEKSDEELMILYQGGTEAAFRVLYARHSQKIWSFIKRRVRNQEQCTDIFQEVFMKIHKSKHLYNRDLPVLPWIFTITRNTIVDEIRKTKNYKGQENIDDLNLMAPELPLVTPSLPIELNAIPVNQKSAIHMRYVEEKTFEDIAGILGTSEANIRKLVSRGIKRLRELLEGEKP